MSVRRTLSVVGAVLAGTVSASRSDVPPADPEVVRALLVDIGLLPSTTVLTRVTPILPPETTAASAAATLPTDEAAVKRALRRFQAGVGLTPDGVAGPKTCHQLARYAREAREMRALGIAA